MSGMMKKMSVCGMTTALLAVGLVNGLRADVILDEPNLKGTVGLAGETFGSGSVTVSWSGGSVSNPLSSGDSDFALRADLDKRLNLCAYMYSFASSGARLYQYINGISALENILQDKPRTLDLMRDSGRIRGSVNVTGNSGSEGVTYMRMDSSAQPSSTESYSGYVVDTTAPFAALQPMPALPNTKVSGSAILRKAKIGGGECSIPVSLPAQSVAVPDSGTVDATWSIDMTQLTCPPPPEPPEPPKTGSIQGNVTLSGLDGLNADAFSSQRVYVSNRYSDSLSDPTSSYSISAIPVGNRSVYLYSYFKSPYNRSLSFSSGRVSVVEGVTTTYDIAKSVGTLHGKIITKGTWNMIDVSNMYARFTGTVSTSNYVDLTTGQFDLVVPVGTEYLYRLVPYFYTNNGSRIFSQAYDRYYNSVTSPIKATIAVGDRLENRNLEFETSAINQGIYLGNTSVGIKRLDIQGKDYDPATDSLLGTKRINLTSNLTGSGTATNGVIVPIYGEPGSYKMTAVANGDDGGTYRKEFTLELMSPQCTGPGYSSPALGFSTWDGTPIGSVEFNNATGSTSAGCTVINVSNIGPRPPANFSVYHGNSPDNSSWYVDLLSTVNFSGTARVCLNYDPSALTANANSLKLGHYVCSSAPCVWEKINNAVVNTAKNTICGDTPSFSIFAILEPLDQDDDGIFDSEDNCPETPNADQADMDEDGYGDACDSDIDGDGIVDDEDRCPWVASQNNEDLDGDGLGDICDDDIDGDEVANEEDNCPLGANANQADFDSDGQGDACDLDDDNDGIEDSNDNCAGTQADVLIDGEGCSSTQRFMLICPPEASYKNHGGYISCIAKESERQLAEELITEEVKDAAVSAAAQSDIGSKK